MNVFRNFTHIQWQKCIDCSVLEQIELTPAVRIKRGVDLAQKRKHGSWLTRSRTLQRRLYSSFNTNNNICVHHLGERVCLWQTTTKHGGEINAFLKTNMSIQTRTTVLVYSTQKTHLHTHTHTQHTQHTHAHTHGYIRPSTETWVQSKGNAFGIPFCPKVSKKQSKLNYKM